MHRLIRDLRAHYEAEVVRPDALPSADSTRRSANDRAMVALPRLDRMVLAGLTQSQIDRLVQAPRQLDTLAILAGGTSLPNDPVPQALLAAIVRIGDDPTSCALFGQVEKKRFADEAYLKVSKLLFEPSIPKDTLAVRKRTERTERVACAFAELRERDPAIYLSAIRRAEEEASHAVVAAKLDTLTRATTAVVILRKIRTRWLAPLTSRRQAEAFWRQRGLAPLNVGSISGSSKAGTSFTELASPLLQMIRVSVNAVLAAEQKKETPASEPATAAGASARASGALVATEDEDESSGAIQRLLTGGGLFNVSFAWPLAYHGWNQGAVDVMALVVPRFGLTAPILGAVGADSATLNMDLGMELHAKLLDAEDGVGVVTQMRWANARGSRNFVESLGLTDKHNVTYATASVGFLFGKQYLITASRAIGGPELIRRSPWQVGLTVVRLAAAQ